VKCPLCKSKVMAILSVKVRTKFKNCIITFEGEVCVKCRDELKAWGVKAILKKL